MSTKFSAFTSDLDRRPELREEMLWAASKAHRYEVRETVSPDGTVTTFERR